MVFYEIAGILGLPIASDKGPDVGPLLIFPGMNQHVFPNNLDQVAGSSMR